MEIKAYVNKKQGKLVLFADADSNSKGLNEFCKLADHRIIEEYEFLNYFNWRKEYINEITLETIEKIWDGDGIPRDKIFRDIEQYIYGSEKNFYIVIQIDLPFSKEKIMNEGLKTEIFPIPKYNLDVLMEDMPKKEISFGDTMNLLYTIIEEYSSFASAQNQKEEVFYKTIRDVVKGIQESSKKLADEMTNGFKKVKEHELAKEMQSMYKEVFSKIEEEIKKQQAQEQQMKTKEIKLIENLEERVKLLEKENLNLKSDLVAMIHIENDFYKSYVDEILEKYVTKDEVISAINSSNEGIQIKKEVISEDRKKDLETVNELIRERNNKLKHCDNFVDFLIGMFGSENLGKTELLTENIFEVEYKLNFSEYRIANLNGEMIIRIGKLKSEDIIVKFKRIYENI